MKKIVFTKKVNSFTQGKAMNITVWGEDLFTHHWNGLLPTLHTLHFYKYWHISTF